MINIEQAMDILKNKRPVFTSEADFQLELGWVLKTMYPEARIRLEYTPYFNTDMHIDILVFQGNKWIPIELKYKTKKCTLCVGDEVFKLKNHSAQDVGRYLYLHDIERIEYIKHNSIDFEEGYTIMITNDLSYTAPCKPGCCCEQFAINEGITKTGILDWSANTSAGTKKNNETPITLESTYQFNWKEYSTIDNSKAGKFMYNIIKVC